MITNHGQCYLDIEIKILKDVNVKVIQNIETFIYEKNNNLTVYIE